MNRVTVAVALVLTIIVAVGLGLGPSTPEDRVAELSRGIRCPVCQAESIADSPSTTAREMVALVTEQVEADRSDDEVRAFFVARYGRWILLDPGVSPATAALWVLPLVAVSVGVVVLRRQTARDEDETADDDEFAELRDRVASLRARTERADDR